MVSRSSTLLAVCAILLISTANADAPACEGVPYATASGLACQPVRLPPAGPTVPRSGDLAEQLRRTIAETEAAKRAYEEGAASYAKALSESALRAREISDDAQARLTLALADLARARHEYESQTAALLAAAPDQKLAQIGSGIEQRLGDRLKNSQAALDSTQSEVKTLRDAGTAANQRMDQLAAGLQHAQTSLDGITAAVSGVQADHNELSGFRQRLDEVQKANAATEQKAAQLEQLKSAIDKLHSDLASTQASLDQAAASTKESQGRDLQAAQDLHTQLAQLQQRVDADEKTVATGLQQAQTSLGTLETGLTNLNRVSQDNQKALSEVQKATAATEQKGGQFEPLKSATDKLHADLASTQAAVAQAAANAKESQSRDLQGVQDLHTQLAQLQQRVDGDEKTVAALRAAPATIVNADNDYQQMRAVIAEQSRRIQALERQVAAAGGQSPSTAPVSRNRDARPIKAEPSGRLDCAALAPDNERMWDLAVAKAYPGFRLVYVDPQSGSAWMSSAGGATQAAPLDQIAHRAGCSAHASS